MLAKTRSYFRRKFGFSESEIRGIFILTPLVVLIVFVPTIFKILWSDTSESTQDQALLEKWYRESNANVTKAPIPVKKDIRFFDPNDLTEKDWINLGFDPKVARRIIRYRSKGGKFRSKEDVFKIYGISEQRVLSYLPYMIVAKRKPLPGTYDPDLPSARPKQKKEPVFVKPDLNQGDTTDFTTIHGVGSYWAGRIVRYREALGGFVAPSQIHELYGIEKELADWVVDHSVFNKIEPAQISINQDSIKLLASHPYISYKTAKRIVNYRQQHGDYEQVSDLSEIVTLSDSLLQKIAPYLTVSK